jgi:hypothetical protein
MLSAWRTLRVVDGKADVAGALRKARPSAWFLDWLPTLVLLTRAIDERQRVAAVPALVDLMRAGHQPASCARVLRAITLRNLGTDDKAWAAFYASHRDKPYAEWITEGARAGALEDRLLGYELLGRLSRTPAGDAALAEGLASEDGLVRLAAARGLALAGRDQGAEVLVDALDGTSNVRALAFDALASFADDSLGYNPTEAREERAAAIARWREWLRRRRFPSKP